MQHRRSDLSLRDHGAAHFPAALSEVEVRHISDALDINLGLRPGQRVRTSSLAPILKSDGAVGRIAASLIGHDILPVRAVFFDKTQESNWAVAWHQDRTIVVRERLEVEGFGPWSTKDNLLHVAPPIAVLEGMVTLRVHLDACPADCAPLKIAIGSHRFGRVSASEVAERAAKCPTFVCLADRGDIWAYSTPILHASERSRSANPRKVLQIDFATRPLPSGLQWLGIDE